VSSLGFGGEYAIEKEGKQIGTSNKIQFFNTNITITDPKGTVVAKIYRPYRILWVDQWQVSVDHPEIIDTYVIAMIGALNTIKKRESQSSSSRSRRSSY